ncbi:MAG TPA: metallophosphoesterase [Actinobacteria bacterium]|nr:metallophosphoesterase [Actinomycetota bacterium]
MGIGKAVVGTAALGAAGLAYAYWEAQHFTVRRVEITVLPLGQPDLRILHLSDMHFVPGQSKKHLWLQSLRDLEPDLVVVTGDFLADVDAIPHVLDSLDPLFDLPGAFVLGSNDYFAPRPLNPFLYFQSPTQLEPTRPMLPWQDLVDGLSDMGWQDLTNASATIKADGRALELRGVDDPHISRDRYQDVAGPFDASADLSIGVVHAPYKRVLNGFVGDGADLVLAGHTHGGQLRLPGYGALVTNCDLDRKAARGLSTYEFHDGEDDLKAVPLHVSAGCGTSPYAPFRFACRPEATLLTLTAPWSSALR